MSDFEAVARGQRAEALMGEFLGPVIAEMRHAYTDRIVEVASKELDPKARSEKLTSLSIALRIVENIEAGITAHIMDGERAEKNLVKVENIEKMTAPKRRIFDIAPRY